MSAGSLEELFLDELKDLYSAEKQITKALARLLGQKEIMALLDETLKEEEAADKKLTQVAKEVNSAALDAAPVRKAN